MPRRDGTDTGRRFVIDKDSRRGSLHALGRFDGDKAYPGHTGSDIDEPSKTIKAGGHGVPGGENTVRMADGSIRYLSVLEAKRIQTFPDDYVITGAWGEAMRQLGNAVPVRLAYIVGNSVMNAVATT